MTAGEQSETANSNLSISRRQTFLTSVGAAYMLGSSTVKGEETTEIQTWHDLNSIRENLAGDYVLASSLDAETDGYTEHVSSPDRGWEPIGEWHENPFTGTLTGNGNRISDLIINRPEESEVGLFRTIHEASITDIKLHDVEITGRRSVGSLVGIVMTGTLSNVIVDGEVKHRGVLGGGLVGHNEGTITECTTTGSVTGISGEDETANETGGIAGANGYGGKISDVYVEGPVEGDGRIGGVAGRNSSGTIEYATVAETVTGTTDRIGGVVGWLNDGGTVNRTEVVSDVYGSDDVGGIVGLNAEGSIEQSIAGGTVIGSIAVGGIVGHNSGEITESASQGAVTDNREDKNGVGGQSTSVGGCVGQNDEDGIISQCYTTGTVEGEEMTGGVAGKNIGEITTVYWNGEKSDQSDCVGDNAGEITNVEERPTNDMTGITAEETMNMLDFTDPWVTQTDPADYPTLQWQVEDNDRQSRSQDDSKNEVETNDNAVRVTNPVIISAGGILSLVGIYAVKRMISGEKEQ